MKKVLKKKSRFGKKEPELMCPYINSIRNLTRRHVDSDEAQKEIEDLLFNLQTSIAELRVWGRKKKFKLF